MPYNKFKLYENTSGRSSTLTFIVWILSKPINIMIEMPIPMEIIQPDSCFCSRNKVWFRIVACWKWFWYEITNHGIIGDWSLILQKGHCVAAIKYKHSILFSFTLVFVFFICSVFISTGLKFIYLLILMIAMREDICGRSTTVCPQKQSELYSFDIYLVKIIENCIETRMTNQKVSCSYRFSNEGFPE